MCAASGGFSAYSSGMLNIVRAEAVGLCVIVAGAVACDTRPRSFNECVQRIYDQRGARTNQEQIMAVLGDMPSVVKCCDYPGAPGDACATYRSSVADKNPKPSAPAPSEPASAALPGPDLMLLDWRWHEEYGYAIVEGQVKNASARTLRNVQAVAVFTASDDSFITSDSTLIEYNPILPGQTSPFKVMVSFNPRMDSARLDFKTLSGGSLSWTKAPVRLPAKPKPGRAVPPRESLGECFGKAKGWPESVKCCDARTNLNDDEEFSCSTVRRLAEKHAGDANAPAP